MRHPKVVALPVGLEERWSEIEAEIRNAGGSVFDLYSPIRKSEAVMNSAIVFDNREVIDDIPRFDDETTKMIRETIDEVMGSDGL